MRRSGRSGFVTLDALVGISLVVIAVAAAVALAAGAVTSIARTRDRLEAASVARALYEDLYFGRRPDGQYEGESGGRSWSYETRTAATASQPSLARRAVIRVDRRRGKDLIIEAHLPPVPALPPSSS